MVEVNEKCAVVLKKDGSYMKIKNNGKMYAGYEAEVPEVKGSSFLRPIRTAVAAASFLIVIGMGYGVYSYNSPYSYVSVDINPGIDITANIFDRIIRIEAVNEDGEILIRETDIRNKSLDSGLEQIMQAAVESGYLKPSSPNTVMITVSSGDSQRAALLEEKIQLVAMGKLEKESIEGDLLVEQVTVEKHEEAKEMGITSGRLNLMEKLSEAEPGINAEELKDATVKDIINKIQETKKAGGEEDRTGRKDTDGNNSFKSEKTGASSSNSDKRAQNRTSQGGRRWQNISSKKAGQNDRTDSVSGQRSDKREKADNSTASGRTGTVVNKAGDSRREGEQGNYTRSDDQTDNKRQTTSGDKIKQRKNNDKDNKKDKAEERGKQSKREGRR